MARSSINRSVFRITSLLAILGTAGVLAYQSLAQQAPTPVDEPNKSEAFTTQANVEEETTRFIAFGDSGSGAKQQFDVAAEMLRYYKQKPFEAVLIMGDVIYPDGDVAKLGEARFKKPYKPLLEDNHIPFIVALGNHDVVRGNIPEQVAFYKMPNRYYKKTVGKADLVEIFVLDTNTYSKDPEQIKWLDKELKDSKAPWKIVIGHHPIYTSGLHGNNQAIEKTLKPLLLKYHVPLYLAGHDHHYERFEAIDGVTYIVSGGGGAYLRPVLIPKKHSLKHAAVFHFLALEASPKMLRIDAVKNNGEELDTVTLHQ